MRTYTTMAVVLVLAGCSDPSPQPQPNEMEQVIDATRYDTGVAPGGLSNGTGNYAEGSVTPGERPDNAAASNSAETNAGSPAQVVRNFAELLEQRRFTDAAALWDKDALSASADAFAGRFDQYRTINAAVGKTGPVEGAAGSLYDEVQLTLSGTRKDGSNYAVTGPVTLRRVNDVPGSTEEQRRWHIVKMVLTSDPQKADALVSGNGG